MDLFFLCGIILSLVAILVVQALLTCKTTRPLPPGSFGLPIVGESFEFWSSFRAGTPQDFIFKRMERHSRDVFKSSILGMPVAFMCGPDASKFMFANDNKLTRHWWPPTVLSVLEPSRRRPFPFKQLIHMFYKVDNIRKQIGILDTVAQAHFATEWQGRQEVVAFELARKYAFTVGCRLALSIEDPKVIARLQAHTTAILSGIIKPKINFPGSARNRALKAWNSLRDELAEMVRERRTKTNEKDLNIGYQDTLSSSLAAIRESGHEMSDKDIANRLIGVLLSLQDTTGNTMSMIVKYLGMNPEAYDAVFRENMEVAAMKKPGEALNWDDIQKMKYSWNVARETMRLCPPIDGLLREAVSDFNYAGYHIPKGWKLYISIKTIHMDPKYFPEPEKFDPSRFEGEGPLPGTYMPFGGGVSTCAGKSFAQVLLLVFIHNVVKRFKWELTPGSNNQLIVDPLPRAISGVPVRLYPHLNKASV